MSRITQVSAQMSSNDVEMRLFTDQDTNNESRRSEKTVNFSSELDINENESTSTGTKPKTKNVQFSKTDFEFDSQISGKKPNLIPNRIREENLVMEHLRKIVGERQLDKNFKQKQEPEIEEVIVNPDIAPLLSEKLQGVVEALDALKVETDKDFIIDCLCWHNEYRARHRSNALTISTQLCKYAQSWADHLSKNNELYYCGRNFSFGQNIFCCSDTSITSELTGQEAVQYWYLSVKKYDYFKHPSILHTNANAGHFVSVVWRKTKYLGIGKAMSTTGKIFVVAFYYPPGNIPGEYNFNVLPPIFDTDEVSETASNKA